MPKTKQQKRTKKRTGKQKKSKSKQRTLPKILQHNPALREALNWRHPLAGCLINSEWQENGMAIVMIKRRAPNGLVFGSFLIDLLGRGLKDVMGNYGLLAEEVDQLDLGPVMEAPEMIPCDIELAADLVYGGLAWAKKWRFHLPRDYKLWLRLLAPRSLEAVDLSRFGQDGKPFLIVGQVDDDEIFCPDVDAKVLQDPLPRPEGPVSTDLLSRLADIKGALIDYSRQAQFRSALKTEMQQRFGDDCEPEDRIDWYNFQDRFVLEYKTASGQTIVDHFLKTYQKKLHPDVAEMVTTWKQVMEAIFEVKERFDRSLLMRNLINEVDYRVYKTDVNAPLPDFKKGDFLFGRIVPAFDFHIFSGALFGYSAEENSSMRKQVYADVAQLQLKNPKAAFRDNPEKLRQSRESSKHQYALFVEYFGADEVLGSGVELKEKLRAFFHYQLFERKDPETGLSRAQTYQNEHGRPINALQPTVPDVLMDQKDVALLCDPCETLTFLKDYALFLDIIRQPEAHLGGQAAEDTFMGYLESNTVSDVPFRRAAQRFPENFTSVVTYYAEKEGFSARTIDELMDEFKPWTADKLPGIVSILDPEIEKCINSPEAN